MVTIGRVSSPTGVVYQSDKVKLKINNRIIGTGELYISVSSLAWQPASFNNPETTSEDGISISWREISVHGVTSTPTKCIYFMLDQKLSWRGVYDAETNGVNGDPQVGERMEQHGGEEADEEDEGNVSDEENDMTECWLIPDDMNTVDIIFQSMSDCQTLNSDNNSDLMDNEDNDDDDFDEDFGGMQDLNIN